MVGLFLLMGSMPMLSLAQDARGLQVGGYDVTKIAVATIDLLQEKGIATIDEAKAFRVSLSAAQPPDDPLVADPHIIDWYRRLGTLFVEKGVATSEEIARLHARAQQSGGLRVAGQNPLVLATSFLDLLVTKKLVTLQQAQSILDTAKQPL